MTGSALSRLGARTLSSPAPTTARHRRRESGERRAPFPPRGGAGSLLAEPGTSRGGEGTASRAGGGKSRPHRWSAEPRVPPAAAAPGRAPSLREARAARGGERTPSAPRSTCSPGAGVSGSGENRCLPRNRVGLAAGVPAPRLLGEAAPSEETRTPRRETLPAARAPVLVPAPPPRARAPGPQRRAAAQVSQENDFPTQERRRLDWSVVCGHKEVDV